jgi:hypothetical protein
VTARRGADRTAVANFLASLDGLSAVEAFSNARADGKSYGWNAATQNAIAAGITKHFADKRDARLAARRAADAVVASLPITEGRP